MLPPPKTQLADVEPVVVPVKSQQRMRLDKTNLLARPGKIWGDTPSRLIQHLDLRNGVYGFVGLSDRTMYPILRPGTIVQIDQDERKILPVEWENEHERPIYFLELRGEYICSWCEMSGGYLSSIPHPNSKCEVRRFPIPVRRRLSAE